MLETQLSSIEMEKLQSIKAIVQTRRSDLKMPDDSLEEDQLEELFE